MRILSFRILIFCIKKTTCYSSDYKKLKLIELQKIKMKKYQKYHISYKIFQFNSIKFLTNKINCATAEIQLESSKIHGGGTINPLWKRIMVP